MMQVVNILQEATLLLEYLKLAVLGLLKVNEVLVLSLTEGLPNYTDNTFILTLAIFGAAQHSSS